MKRTLTYFLLLFFPMLLHAQENAYLEQIRVADYQLQSLDNERVQLEMTLHFDQLKLNAQHALRIVPKLVSADGTKYLYLDAIQLYGKQRYKVQLRANRLSDVPMVTPGDRLHIYRKGHTAPLDYTLQLPFRPWMVDCYLRIEASVIGCAQCDEGAENLALSQALLPASILTPQQNKTYLAAIGWQPLYADALPIAEEEKLYNKQLGGYLQFAQGRHDIRPSLGNNIALLDSALVSLKGLADDERITLIDIQVQGYASPEGRVTYNQRLSERRAKSFVDYIATRNTQIERALFRAEGRGENWEYFRSLLKEAPLSQAAELVQQAIDYPERQDNIDRQLRNLPIGRTLMNDYYPQLRRITFIGSYRVRPIGVEEGRQLVNTRPDLLSPYELQQVADSYLPDTQQYISVLQKAARAYNHAKNPILAYNLALAQYKANQLDEALQTLLSVEPNAAVYNLRGVILYQTDRYDEAIQAFRQAAQMGSEEAKQNLIKLKIASY